MRMKGDARPSLPSFLPALTEKGRVERNRRIRIKDVNTLKIVKTKHLKKIGIKFGAWMVGLEILAKLKKMSLYPVEYKLRIYPRIGGTSKRDLISISRTFLFIFLLRLSI